MTKPRSNQFGSYFKALHGYDSFPWQRRLTATILETEAWPALLDIPTGLGKTSAIDIALFVLAVRPDLAPRRIIVVVDRRVVVDQAADHAHKIQKRLANATEGVLATVATSLRELWDGPDDAAPFEVAVLRGGMPRDEAWAHRPDRPVVALSTVDQVGSRLLFRGYGVSAGVAPIHAGMLGNDALLLLDEVQLSTAFAETLRAIDERWRPWRERDHELGERVQQIPNRWGFVRMSATPLGETSKEDVRFALDDDDLAHPVVEQRRSASKVATLAEPVTTTKSDTDKTQHAVVEAFSRGAMGYLEGGSRRVAVIVNRVATARHIHAELKRRAGKLADVVLLTGRMRPVDRRQVFGDANEPTSVAGRVTAGSARVSDQRPVIVVSTQTIEAGADFDFDALVTECASIDALRQRFGRLDRRGELGETHATILIRKDQATDSQDDPVYGAALAKTWAWLEAKGGKQREVDFGIAKFPSLPRKANDLAELCSPVQHAPVMLPAHLDAWAQTKPRGEPDPDVALWLHGPERGTPEVRVVWRADIDEDALNDESPIGVAQLTDYASASLAVAPPSSLESISVPLPAFRTWIARERTVDFSDVEGAGSLSESFKGGDDGRHETRAFLIASKSGAAVHRDTEELYPEATVVVPASYGGISDGNWNPDATQPVRDLGDLAQLLHRGRPVLRLVPEVLCFQLGKSPHDDAAPNVGAGYPEELAIKSEPTGLELPATVARTAPTLPNTEDPDFNPRAAVREWLESTRETGSALRKQVVDALLKQGNNLRVIELGRGGHSSPLALAPVRFAAVGQRLTNRLIEPYRKGVDSTSDIVSDDDDSASYIGQEVALTQHLGDVERWARNFAKNLELPRDFADDLALAARLHDIGKADPRFQQMLHGGSAVRTAASTQLLAKSRGDAGDRAARKQARQRSNYPEQYRHELLSVAMLGANAQSLAQANDRDLVLHLVGSHHGWCRPFAPAVAHGPSMDVEFSLDGIRYVADAAHGLASLDSGVADRYWLLTERYGWWTLAWFEALLRLADHRASEESSCDGEDGTRTGTISGCNLKKGVK
jgi:CRISPR-associated endonuclease/helicase Cas3